MDSEHRPIIAVVGPTASGKTRKAVELAHVFDAEIVSGDSRQVYRRMDIGTGKDIGEYGDIPYHVVDICEPGEKYNLYRYLGDFAQACHTIRGKGKRIIVCGGSGMYIENALNNVSMPLVPRNESLRESLQGKDLRELTQILASMKTLHNTTDVDTVQRAIRAIEIQSYYREHPHEVPVTTAETRHKAVVVALYIDRDRRRERITHRLNERLKHGMVEEVERLIAEGIVPETLIYYGLEYKWVTLYVTGKVPYEMMVNQLETAIHQFAKRQMTWLRGMEKRGHLLHWVPFDIDGMELAEKIAVWEKGI